MDNTWKTIIWNQFGASIDMLGNAIESCPDDLWTVHMWKGTSLSPEFSEFWYVAFHALFWLDLYLYGSIDGFAPFFADSLHELDPEGILPEKQYSKVELRSYLKYCRHNCLVTIESLTDEKAHQICKFSWGEISFAELLLDTMRHVQEHSAQLNLILGQKIGLNNHWIAQVKN